MIYPGMLQKTVATQGYCIEPMIGVSTVNGEAHPIELISFSECIPAIIRVTSLNAGGVLTFSSNNNNSEMATIDSDVVIVQGSGHQRGTRIRFLVNDTTLLNVGQTFEIRDVSASDTVMCYGAIEAIEIPQKRVTAFARFVNGYDNTGVVVGDEIFNIDPLPTFGFYIGANETVTLATPNWSTYLLFKREGATNATVLVTKVG